MRSRRGQAAMALNLVIAIFVVGSLGIAAYEFSRLLLARDQLKHCVELAALAGATTLASTTQTGAAARANAKTTAMRLFQKNTVLGISLSSATEITTKGAFNPPAGGAQLYFEFEDPITKQPAAPGSDANLLKVYGAYTYPFFSNGFGSIGVTAYTVVAEALSGLPALDIAIVYNTSGSNDDQTKVTFVRRYWNQTPPMQISYIIPNPGGTPEEGTLGGIVCSNPLGTALNGLEPQNLDAAGDPLVAKCPKEFSEVGNQGNTVPLRGINNTGSPPGDAPTGLGGVGLAGMTAGPGNTKDTFVANAPWRKMWSMFHKMEQPADAQSPPPSNPYGAQDSLFTDVIVNLDGNNHFNGYTDPRNGLSQYPFPDIMTVVEAARGNLENGNLFPDAQATLSAGVVETIGYKSAYRSIAYGKLEPMNTVNQSVRDFMKKLMQTTDCHMCFVSYANRAGTSPNDFETYDAVSWAYPSAGNVESLLPQIPLSRTQDNYKTVDNLLTPPNRGVNRRLMLPNGGANLADGLKEAMANLTGAESRLGAGQAIIVITDKTPTRDLAGVQYTTGNTPAWNDAMQQASLASAKGIPIFIVALDQTGQMTSQMLAQYGDGSTGTTAGGITNPAAGPQGNGVVAAAGHGGMLKIVPWVDPQTTHTAMQGEFYNVVRQLITLVHN